MIKNYGLDRLTNIAPGGRKPVRNEELSADKAAIKSLGVIAMKTRGFTVQPTHLRFGGELHPFPSDFNNVMRGLLKTFIEKRGLEWVNKYIGPSKVEPSGSNARA